MKTQNNNETDYVIIPNPIYDVVFKYLMEDKDSAKIILSTLINEKIIKLDLEPLSHSEKKEEQNIKELRIKDPKTDDDIRLLHLDFTATVKLPDGKEELIMIELQKASKPDDIFRFKRYISKNFQKKVEKEIIDHKTKAVKVVKVPIRLIPIFILNFRIEHEVNDLLVKTNNIKEGVFTNKNLQKSNEFIDNLTYSIWVVQLPNIKKIEKSESYKENEYKTKLFQLLKLFDQKSIVKTNEHRLRIIKKVFPGFLDRVIQRLQAADIDNPDLEEQMNAEDEYLRALEYRDNKISELEQENRKKDKTIGEKEKMIGEKEKMIGEKEKMIGEKEKTINEKEKTIGEKEKTIINLARVMKRNNISIEIIMNETKLPEEIIDSL